MTLSPGDQNQRIIDEAVKVGLIPVGLDGWPENHGNWVHLVSGLANVIRCASSDLEDAKRAVSNGYLRKHDQSIRAPKKRMEAL